MYTIVKAKSEQEARERFGVKDGDMVRVQRVLTIANSDGTFTMIPVFGGRDERQGSEVG